MSLKITNYDKIKNLDFEEMIDFLHKMNSCVCCIYGGKSFCKDTCRAGIKKWLKRSVKNGRTI